MAAVTFDMPKCYREECDKDAEWLVKLQPTSRHPLWGMGEPHWLCDRHKRVALVLAERYELVLVCVPRWRVTTELLAPPW